MPPFRFKLPFFSYGSPSRLSSASSSPLPPPTPPPSRPPFRPAGVAQPSKTATESKVPPPSLSRSKSNVKAISASSSSASQSPSRGAATPTLLSKQSNQSGSPLKKPESMGVEEQKVAMREKPSREIEKEAGEKIDPVTEKAVQEQRKKTEVEKLAAEELGLETAHEQRQRKETEKLAVEEKKNVLHKDMEENSDKTHEQLVRKETAKLVVEENKKVLHKDIEENSKTAKEQHKRKETEKLASQERNRALHKMTREDATQSKSTRHIASASESKGPKDTPERSNTQNITETHTDDNHQKVKTELTSNHGNPRVVNGERSSSMSRKIKEDIRDGISKLTWGKSNSDEKSVSVYTLTGENKGATMGIASDKAKKDGEVHIRRGYKSNPYESPNTTATDSEGERKHFKGKNFINSEKDEEARVRAYINGNNQAINNSIVFESSVRENNPGIHMIIKFEKRQKKDETRVSPPENETEKQPEKLKYEPRVRRRCLRGLLAETSESDPENPLKPRRHGCRFTCKDKDIENT